MEIPDRGRMGCGHAWENDSLCRLVVRLTPGKPLQMQQLKRETHAWQRTVGKRVRAFIDFAVSYMTKEFGSNA
jgi:hypothetical protein